MKINPKVIDIYHLNANDAHGNDGADFHAAYAFGIRGVIHKAMQVTGDRLYPVRRPKALAAGLLWGAYHFNTGESAQVQAKRFLDFAAPDRNTVCALDWEDENGVRHMHLHTAREFMEYVDEALVKLGQKPDSCVLYSGNVVKEEIVHADDETRTFFGSHRLWLAQYSATPVMTDYNHHPLPWKAPWLWQYTGDGAGLQPHSVPGIGHNVDINSFDGTDDELKAQWSA
jgi:lysozyme